MITVAQMRAARAMQGIDQRQLAEPAGVSLPTIQRMEASDGVVLGGVIDVSSVPVLDSIAAITIEGFAHKARRHGAFIYVAGVDPTELADPRGAAAGWCGSGPISRMRWPSPGRKLPARTANRWFLPGRYDGTTARRSGVKQRTVAHRTACAGAGLDLPDHY